MEPSPKSIDLMEWESLFRHPNFEKITDLIKNRMDNIQLSVRNRAKLRMNLDVAVESAADLRVVAEFDKLLQYFESLKHQILQNKGVKNG